MAAFKGVTGTELITYLVGCLIFLTYAGLGAVELFRARQRMPPSTYTTYTQATIVCISFLSLMRGGLIFIPVINGWTSIPPEVSAAYHALVAIGGAFFGLAHVEFAVTLFQSSEVNEQKAAAIPRSIYALSLKAITIACSVAACIASIIMTFYRTGAYGGYVTFALMESIIAVLNIGINIVILVSISSLFGGALIGSRLIFGVFCLVNTILFGVAVGISARGSFGMFNIMGNIANMVAFTFVFMSYLSVRVIRDAIHRRLMVLRKQFESDHKKQKRDEQRKQRKNIKKGIAISPAQQDEEKMAMASPGLGTEEDRALYLSLQKVMATQLRKDVMKEKARQMEIEMKRRGAKAVETQNSEAGSGQDSSRKKKVSSPSKNAASPADTMPSNVASPSSKGKKLWKQPNPESTVLVNGDQEATFTDGGSNIHPSGKKSTGIDSGKGKRPVLLSSQTPTVITDGTFIVPQSQAGTAIYTTPGGSTLTPAHNNSRQNELSTVFSDTNSISGMITVFSNAAQSQLATIVSNATASFDKNSSDQDNDEDDDDDDGQDDTGNQAATIIPGLSNKPKQNQNQLATIVPGGAGGVSGDDDDDDEDDGDASNQAATIIPGMSNKHKQNQNQLATIVPGGAGNIGGDDDDDEDDDEDDGDASNQAATIIPGMSNKPKQNQNQLATIVPGGAGGDDDEDDEDDEDDDEYDDDDGDNQTATIIPGKGGKPSINQLATIIPDGPSDTGDIQISQAGGNPDKVEIAAATESPRAPSIANVATPTGRATNLLGGIMAKTPQQGSPKNSLLSIVAMPPSASSAIDQNKIQSPSSRLGPNSVKSPPTQRGGYNPSLGTQESQVATIVPIDDDSGPTGDFTATIVPSQGKDDEESGEDYNGSDVEN